MSFAAEAVAPSEGTAHRATERRNYRVATHLGMFAAGILVPVLLIVAFMLINTARLMRDDALHDAHLIAQHLNETIDVELEKAIAVDETLAAALALDDSQHAGFEAQAWGEHRGARCFGPTNRQYLYADWQPIADE